MEVKEKRKALDNYCARTYEQYGECCEENCVITINGMCKMYDDIPDEQVELWYGKAFPEEVKEEQRVFSTGAKRDSATGKGRFDLLPWGAIWEVAKHCERGSIHYGTHNVDKGIPTSCLLDSCIRHLCKHLMGYTDEPHLVAAAWNALWAVQMCITHPELVDTPWKEGAE